MAGHRATLSNLTFKMDRLDFFSMTQDKEMISCQIHKDDSILHNLYTHHTKTAIYTSHKDAVVLRNDFTNKPKLITITKQVNTNHHPSVLGNCILDSIGYSNKGHTPQEFIDDYNGQYVAKLAKIFYINSNNIEIWNEFCTNGLFNIWNPAAPYNRLNKSMHQVDSFNYDTNVKKYNVANENENYMHKYQLPSAQILLLRLYALDEVDAFRNNEINVHPKQFDIIEPKKVSLDNPIINDFEFNCIYRNLKDTLNKLEKSIPFFRFLESFKTKK